MATVADFLQRVQRESGDVRPDPIIAVEWLQDRYAEALERNKFTFLVKEATLATVAEFITGDVDLTNGSATITEGTSGANGWSTTLEDRFFRVSGDSEYYKLSSYSDANPDTLQLDRVYEGTTATAASYKIFQRIYSLASDVREVVSIQRINSATELDKVELQWLNQAFPNRGSVGEPLYWAFNGLDSSNLRQVELYPITDEAKGLQYHYIQDTPTLDSGDDTILPQVPISLLVNGWFSSYWDWRSTLDGAGGREINMAAKFEQRFEKSMKELSIREAANQTPQRIRMARHITSHRLRRSSRIRIPITLP